MMEYQKSVNNAYMRPFHNPSKLVEELAVGVRSEEGLSHNRQGAVLEQRQPCLEGVIDLDLASSTENQHTASAVVATN